MNVVTEDMISDLKNIVKNQEESILKEHGFHGQYNKEQLYFIKYVISRFGGLKDKIKITKCLYIVDKLIEMITSDEDEEVTFDDIGRFVCDILEDCGYVKFSSDEEE